MKKRRVAKIFNTWFTRIRSDNPTQSMQLYTLLNYKEEKARFGFNIFR